MSSKKIDWLLQVSFDRDLWQYVSKAIARSGPVSALAVSLEAHTC